MAPVCHHYFSSLLSPHHSIFDSVQLHRPPLQRHSFDLSAAIRKAPVVALDFAVQASTPPSLHVGAPGPQQFWKQTCAAMGSRGPLLLEPFDA